MFKKINKEILSFLKTKNLNKETGREEVEKIWEKTVEEKIKKNATILSFKQGVLTIGAKNPTWRNEISLLKEQIKKKLTNKQTKK